VAHTPSAQVAQSPGQSGAKTQAPSWQVAMMHVSAAMQSVSTRHSTAALQ
jgi:hypothetical protein